MNRCLTTDHITPINVTQGENGQTGLKSCASVEKSSGGSSPATVPSTAGGGASPCTPSCPPRLPWTCSVTGRCCPDLPSTWSRACWTLSWRRPMTGTLCPGWQQPLLLVHSSAHWVRSETKTLQFHFQELHTNTLKSFINTDPCNSNSDTQRSCRGPSVSTSG